MRSVVVVLALFALAGCAQVSDLPADAQPCDEPRPEFCTMEYNPVCGSDGETHGNGCTACSDADVEYYVPGACEGDAEQESATA